MKVKHKLYTVTTILAVTCTATAFLTIRTNFHVVWLPTILFGMLFLTSVLRTVDASVGDTVIQVDSDTAIVVGAAAIFVVLDSPLGFFLAYSMTAIYTQNIRTRSWEKLIFNTSNVMFAGLCCFNVLRFLDISITESLVTYSLKIALACLVFLVVSYLFLAVAMVIEKVKWTEVLYPLRSQLTEIIPLAIFSGLLGRFYFEYGNIMLFMFVVPLFLGRELSASYAQMAQTQKSAIYTLIKVLEAKDKYTAGHVERVAMFAKYIGEELGYGARKLERLHQAALLHDAGKLIVPSNLLNKPGKLTDAEFKIIQRHEFVTIEILQGIDFLASIAVTAGGDHNKMESHRVPKRKLEPYIVSVCDAFDAMTSTRSYRKALSMDIAFEELHSKQGKQFHPVVVEALINAIESRGEHYGDGYETDIVHEDAPEAGIGSAGIGDLEDDATNAPANEDIPSAVNEES